MQEILRAFRNQAQHRRNTMRSDARRVPLFCALTVLCCYTGSVTSAQRVTNSPILETDSLTEIRIAATTRDVSSGHPLPLAAHWRGEPDSSFGPAYQLELLRDGHHILPWLTLPRPDATVDIGRYERAIGSFRKLDLPVSLLSSEWEATLPASARSAERVNSPKPGVRPLSPFSDVDYWKAAGRRWSEQTILRRLQAAYPQPPRIILISNNEEPKLGWTQLRGEVRRVASDAAGHDAEVRCAVGDAWITRYSELIHSLRQGLVSEVWRDASLFAGYNAFGSSSMGRWPGWVDYSLHCLDRLDPWPYAWDGASVAYYVNDWSAITDYTVWSPQIEAMNWVPMLAEVAKAKPAFWFEMSVWDGQQPGFPTDKALFYAARHQQFTPSRYEGMVQFGMWLLRPRVVREFRNPTHHRDKFGPYFERILAAVDRVHASPTLKQFWSGGRLVPNSSETHIFGSTLPQEFAAMERWFLLDTPANPPRPWKANTPLKVFAMALERGDAPHREWLIYAFSPLDASVKTTVRLNDGQIPVVATTDGTFVHYQENGSRIDEIG